MRYTRRAAGVGVVVLVVCSVYTGYRLDRVRHDLEWYKKTYGYATPTMGLRDYVLENPSWQAILLDSSIAFTDGAHNIEPFDIDGDGDLELVANSYRSDTLMVYDAARNPQDPHAWSRQVIDSRVGGGFPRRPAGAYVKAVLKRVAMGTQMEGAHYTAIADLNGDGRQDLIVAGDLMRDDVTWYQAIPDAGGRTKAWARHVAYRDDSHRTYHVETGDIDDDGDPDIVFTTKSDNSIGWLENRRVPGAWPATIIDSDCAIAFYARVADIDRDGKGEIFVSQDTTEQGGQLSLYAHSGAPGSAANWRKHRIAHLPVGHGLSVFTIRDLDGDGNLDVAGANHQGDIVVVRNPGPAQVFGRWDAYFARRGSLDKGRDFREIDVGDIDGDGDLDIIVADEGMNAILWYENPGETFRDDWRKHIVDQSDVYLRWCHCVRLADIDKDGRLDIAVAAAASNTFLLYLNRMPPRPAQGAQAIHVATSGQDQ